MYKLARKIFFLFNPETIHNFVVWFFGKFTFLYPLFRGIYFPKSDMKSVTVRNLKFRNPLGLAAGLDKDGEALRFWEALGFSYVEAGTVTPAPQFGNPKPRLFRILKDEGLLNRMGFNNNGAKALREEILKAKTKIKAEGFYIGANIGKNKLTPIQSAKYDYTKCMEILHEAADFFTINISSPNTEGLRKLQSGEYFDDLIKTISEKNSSLSNKVIFVKIAPDLSEEEITQIYNTAVKYDIDGIVATNTTISREGFPLLIDEAGGISGKPLKEKSDKVLKTLNELNAASPKKLFLIGCGGIFSADDLADKIKLGAALTQVYTSFIYEGPAVVKKLLK